MLSFKNARTKNHINLGYRKEEVINTEDVNGYNNNNSNNSTIMFKKKNKKSVQKNSSFDDVNNQTIYKNSSFYWIHYIILNLDLFYAEKTTPELALTHFNEYGRSEGRQTTIEEDRLSDYLYLYVFLKNTISTPFFDSELENRLIQTYTKEEWDIFNKYPNLFHKYLLFIKNPRNSITFKISKQISIKKPYICAIHCYDLKNFDNYFGEYISIISYYFDILVTYCLDDCDIVNRYEFTFIITQNIGMDIGGKFSAVKFLNDMNINYDYIFFIHSKSDPEKRRSYIEPLTYNMREINNIMNQDKNIGAFIPPWIFVGCLPLMYGDYDETRFNTEGFGINDLYVNELISYLNVRNSSIFLEGNIFILNNKLAKLLYSNIYLFNILNSIDSFDFNWVNNYYLMHDKNYYVAYKNQREQNLEPNNLATGLGHSGLADGMIEHAFERMIFQSCQTYNMRVISFDKAKNHRIDKINKLFNENYMINYEKQALIEIYKTTPKISIDICVIACHTDSNFKLFNIVNNMHYMLNEFDAFYLINSKEFENDNLLEELLIRTYPNIVIFNKLSREQIDYYKNNNPDLLHLNDCEINDHFFNLGIDEGRTGTDYKIVYIFYDINTDLVCYDKFLHFFDTMKIESNKIMLTNDSFLITRPLDNFFKLYTSDCEMTGLLSSNELKYHYPDFLRIYNFKGLNIIIEYIKSKKKIYTSLYNLIIDIEINSVHLFESKKCLYEAESDFYGNIHFDDDKCYKYLLNFHYPLVKLKKILSIYYDSNDIPEDFNEDEYRSLHKDLTDFVDLKGHFLKHGRNEGRKYKKSQILRPPNYIIDYINNYIDNNRNICFYEKL